MRQGKSYMFRCFDPAGVNCINKILTNGQSMPMDLWFSGDAVLGIKIEVPIRQLTSSKQMHQFLDVAPLSYCA